MTYFNPKKCTKVDFHCGFVPDPVGEGLGTPTDPLTALKGPTSKRRNEKKRRQKKNERRETILAFC